MFSLPYPVGIVEQRISQGSIQDVKTVFHCRADGIKGSSQHAGPACACIYSLTRADNARTHASPIQWQIYCFEAQRVKLNS